MKRLITILIALCLLNTGAYAQWYLFPGARGKAAEQQPAGQQTEAPRNEPGDRGQLRGSVTPPAQERQEEEEGGWQSLFGFGGDLSTVRVTLALPFAAGTQKPNANYLEMYGGALLALRDLGEEGVKVRLRVVDTASGALTRDDIEDSDVIIGPVTYAEVRDALPLCGGDKVLVSPLDPKTAELAAGAPVIQAPASWTSQIDELAEWVQEELMPEDELYVIRDASEKGFGEQARYLIDRLNSKVLRYRTVASVSDIAFQEGRTYRILIASDSDAFLTGATRAAAIEAARNRDIILYSTSRIRSTIGTNVNDLYNTKTRLTASYYIDYGSQAVKDFVLAYRALFRSEPGSFAFQGYDTMRYFAGTCADYGRRWYRRLPEYPAKGLQSDFEFKRWESSGKVNVAVRRIVYNSDLTTTLLQN